MSRTRHRERRHRQRSPSTAPPAKSNVYREKWRPWYSPIETFTAPYNAPTPERTEPDRPDRITYDEPHRPVVGAPKTWAVRWCYWAGDAANEECVWWWWHVDGSCSVESVAGGEGREPIWIAQICAWVWA